MTVTSTNEQQLVRAEEALLRCLGSARSFYYVQHDPAVKPAVIRAALRHCSTEELLEMPNMGPQRLAVLRDVYEGGDNG